MSDVAGQDRQPRVHYPVPLCRSQSRHVRIVAAVPIR